MSIEKGKTKNRRTDPIEAGPPHRLREVRRQQGVSLRTMARKLDVDIQSVRQQESDSRDLNLSDLRKWQQALDVPMSDLLVEPSLGLSPAIHQRAQLVRLMKTATAIKEQADTPEIERLAENLVEQLIEMMPELHEVTSWHTVGRRRTLAEFGRILERVIKEDIFWHGSESD